MKGTSLRYIQEHPGDAEKRCAWKVSYLSKSYTSCDTVPPLGFTRPMPEK